VDCASFLSIVIKCHAGEEVGKLFRYNTLLRSIHDSEVYGQYEQQLERFREKFEKYGFMVEPLGITKGYLMSYESGKSQAHINFIDSVLNEEINVHTDAECIENAFLYFGTKKPVWLWFASIADVTAMVILISEFHPKHELIWQKHKDELHWYSSLVNLRKTKSV
jgi:hypothetical protein